MLRSLFAELYPMPLLWIEYLDICLHSLLRAASDAILEIGSKLIPVGRWDGDGHDTCLKAENYVLGASQSYLM